MILLLENRLGCAKKEEEDLNRKLQFIPHMSCSDPNINLFICGHVATKRIRISRRGIPLEIPRFRTISQSSHNFVSR